MGGGKKRDDRKLQVMQKSGECSSVPVEYQVLSEDEFARTVDGPPDESDHQHLQPRALQQLHLVVEGQLQET